MGHDTVDSGVFAGVLGRAGQRAYRARVRNKFTPPGSAEPSSTSPFMVLDVATNKLRPGRRGEWPATGKYLDAPAHRPTPTTGPTWLDRQVMAREKQLAASKTRAVVPGNPLGRYAAAETLEELGRTAAEDVASESWSQRWDAAMGNIDQRVRSAWATPPGPMTYQFGTIGINPFDKANWKRRPSPPT